MTLEHALKLFAESPNRNVRLARPDVPLAAADQALMRPQNERAWALVAKVKGRRPMIRRVVWGLLLARTERREGEIILPVRIEIVDERPRR
jgi:hypothetical protein